MSDKVEPNYISYPRISEVDEVAKAYENAGKLTLGGRQEEKEEDKVEQKVDDEVENQEEIKVGLKVKEKIFHKLEDPFDVNCDSIVKDKFKEYIESFVREKIEEKNGMKIDEKSEEKNGMKIDEKSEEKNGMKIDEKSEEKTEEVKVLTETLEKEHDEKREQWGRPSEFVFALIGWMTGLPCVMVFPYMMYRNGGVVFLVPCLVTFVVLGLPVLLLETMVAQYSALGPLAVGNACPLFKGIGWAMLFTTTVVGAYFNVLLSQVGLYIHHTFQNVLPLKDCNNYWNTPNCQTSITTDFKNNVSMYERKLPVHEFLENKVLQMSPGIEEWGSFNTPLLVSLAVCFLITYLCLFFGVKWMGKVAYVMTTLPILFLIFFLVRALSLPGAFIGVQYLFVPNLYQLGSPTAWINAGMFCIYTFGPTSGCLLAYARHNAYHNNLFKQLLIASMVVALVSLLWAVVVFAFIGHKSLMDSISISELVISGSDVIFILMTEILSKFPMPKLLLLLFYTTILIIGLASAFGMVMTVSCGLEALLGGNLGRKKYFVVALVLLSNLILALPMLAGNGIYIFFLLDTSIAHLSGPIIGILECFALTYLYGTKRLYENMASMFGRKMSVWWKVCWMAVTPLCLAVVVLQYLLSIGSLSYSLVYPHWTSILAWVIRFGPIFIVVIFGVVGFLSTKGSFIERFKLLIKPTELWERNRMQQTLPQPL